MIELFMLEFCGYCKKVMAYLDEHDIPYTTVDISDKGNEEALIRIGGKRQVPFLLDRDKKVELYESDDILEHLRKEYS
jgi:glutaredoxin